MPCDAAESKAWRLAHPEEQRERARNCALKVRYGITATDYDAMFEAQDGRCGMCGAPPGVKRLHTDHDHNTGRVRKLLCHRCNLRLGMVEDEEFMRLATEYLNQFKDADSVGIEQGSTK